LHIAQLNLFKFYLFFCIYFNIKLKKHISRFKVTILLFINTSVIFGKNWLDQKIYHYKVKWRLCVNEDYACYICCKYII